MSELSIRAYAKNRGVSEGAVRKAIKNGRITKKENGKIDANLADKEWQQNTDPAQLKEVKRDKFEKKPREDSNNNLLGPSYQQSRAVKEAYSAKLLRLQFEKESKRLISVDEVKISAFNTARMTRDRILNIPDRVIPLLVGQNDIFEMKKILKEELVKALDELSKNEF